MEERREKAICMADLQSQSCIHDLPDECLVSILSCLDLKSVLPIGRMEDEELTVHHPLQCALVCKRWRSLADAAVYEMYLDCFELRQKLAEDLGSRFNHLTTLTITDATVHGNPLAAIARCTPNLECLQLQGLRPSFPDVVPALRLWANLRRFELGNFPFRPTTEEVDSIMGAVCELKSLQHLRFHYLTIGLTAFCEKINTMTGLTRLELGCLDSAVDFPPVSRSRFSQVLRNLMLGRLKVTELPDELGHLRALEVLGIVTCRSLVTLPETLGRLSILKTLMVSGATSLQSLPQSLGSLSRLQWLHLSKCPQLRTLPDAIEKLTTLRTLHVRSCDGLQPAIDRLRQRTNLNIVHQ